MANSDTAVYADPDAQDMSDTSGSPYVERRVVGRGTQLVTEVTQPNPAAVNLAVWKKIVEAATTSLLVRILQNPKKINEYADDPGNPPGEGRGFLKKRFRAQKDGWLSNTLSEALLGEEDGADPYLGFVKEDQANFDAIRKKTTGLYTGTTTESAEEVVAVFSGNDTSWFQSGNENTLVLSPKQIVQISDLILARPEQFAPHQTEASGLYPDDGSGLLDRNTFNVAANLLQAWGAYDSRSYTSGQVGRMRGRVIKSENGLQNLFLGLSISEEYYEDGPWAAARQYMESKWDAFFGADEGDYIKRPLLTNDDHGEGLGYLNPTTWADLKDRPGLSFKGLDKTLRYDSVVFIPISSSGGHTERINKYLEDFIYRIARNFPGVLQDKLHPVVVDLIENLEQSDKETAALSTIDKPPKSFTTKKREEPKPKPRPPQRDLKPIDLQCFLMENIGLLADFKGAQANPYQNLMQLYGPNAPGETISILNCKGKQEEVKRLLNLTPSTYASLVPYIKLYRLAYTNADDADPLVPIAQQEIPIPNYMDPEDISRITSGQLGRNSGWGLQSFTWKLDGLQPETVDNNISANLKLYFQSVDDLFKGSRNAAGRDQAGRVQPGPLDLLIPSEACRKSDDDDDDPPIGSPPPPPTCEVENQQAKSQGRDGACFRIKVVAGWATPPNLEETHPELKKKAGGSHETEGEILRRALRDTRITLYLQQTRHNLSFNENGSVLLSIDYQAALSGILTDNRMDILGTNDSAIQAKLKELKAKAKGAAGEMETIAGRYGKTKEDLKSLRDDEAYKAQKEKQKEYLQEQIDLQNQDKLKKYKRFLSRLYGRHDGGKSKSPKMYVMEVDPKLVRQKKLADEKDPKKRAARARQLMTNSSATRGWAITNPLTYEAGKSGKNSDLLELLEGVDDPAKASKVTDKMSEQFENNLYSGKNMYIPYFYLGDLIDSILENNDSLRSGDKSAPASFRVFMAEMHVTNPLLLYQAPEKEQTKLMCSSYDSIKSSKLLRQLKAKGYIFDGGIKKRINIGQIPIALDQFNVWFKNKVVKGGLDSYYLLHFIKDICAQLITDSLKKTCFNNNIINNIRFDVSHIHFNNRDSKGAPKYPNGPLHTVPVRSLARLMGDDDTLYRDVPPLGIPLEERARYNMTSGLVLFCTDSKVRNRHGRKGINSDQDVGIYHNYVGSPVGLVKKLSFNRVQQQYLRESKLQKYGNLGAEQLRELYSANLELIGNTLYKNGQYTFLWPSAMTSGDDSRVINLGLGGYFLIKSVDHTISPSGYTVRMTALQEGMEIGPEAEVTLQPIDGDISPDTNPFFDEERGRDFEEYKRKQAEAAAEKAERLAAAAAAAAAHAAREEERQSPEAAAERARSDDTSIDISGEEVDIARGTNKETIEAIQKRHRASPSTPGSRTSYSSTGQRRQS